MNNMQEQHHFKVTPDQGWAKMKPVLDEVMPAGSVSRRYPFLWWTTTAVVLGGLVVFALLTDSIGEDNSSSGVSRAAMVPAIGQHTNQQIIANTSSPQPKETSEIISTSGPTTPAHQQMEDEKLNKQTNNNKPTKTHSRPAYTKRPDQKKAVSIPMTLADDKEPEGFGIEAETVVAPYAATEVVSPESIETSISAMPVLMASVPLRNRQVVEALPELDKVSLRSPGYNQDIVPTGTVIKSKRQPVFIEPGFVVSGFAGQPSGVGAFAGAGINMNISRRFCVTSSIGYFTYNPDGAVFGSSRSLDANAEYNSILQYDPIYTGNEIYVEADAINNQTGYNVISPLVDKITQWQVNAGLKWKFSRRFFTEGGVTVGLFTKGFSTYPIAQQNILSGTPDVRFQNELNRFNVIRSTTTSIYAGMGYRIGQHFDLFANWIHGLNHYLLNDSISSNSDIDSGKRTDYIRGLSLGLRYTL